MKYLLLFGFMTIFISCVFIFFSYDTMVTYAGGCFDGGACNSDDLRTGIFFGFGFIFLFILVDIIVVYLIYKSWDPELYK